MNKNTKKILGLHKEAKEKAFKESLVNRYSIKFYSAKWKGAYTSALISSYLSNSFSFLTGFLAIFIFINFSLADIPYLLRLSISISIAISFSFLLEYSKRNISKNFLVEGFLEKNWNRYTLSAVLGLSAISISLSFYGSARLPLLLSQTPNFLPVSDSLKQAHAQEKTALTARISQMRKENTSARTGRLSSRVSNAVSKMEAGLLQMQQEQNKKIEKEEENFKTAAQKKQQEKEKMGFTIAYISIVIELLFLFSLMYCEKYLYFCFLENKPISDLKDKNHDYMKINVGADLQPSARPHNPQEPHRPIGFKIYKKRAEVPLYNDNTPNPTQQATHHITQVKTTYTHFKKNGETVEYPMWQLKNRIRQYEKKTQESRQKIEEGCTKKKWATLLKNQTAQAVYWARAAKVLEKELKEYDKAPNKTI